ncbi:glycoside hydrolase family 32 protein [Paenibacillus vietnamensis]|uniref:glycoside hydrolase family 32 protein n=1 Tax=Paenibacillus vietnamensis TaxID=2590547 RepID=UPI001CD073DE|nr:glycoside hydrolase family 32 protein [Paenibacillus vietnamensis]
MKLYKEPFRPQFHLTPPQGPMSDPNGMVFFEGEYHQFYQFTGRWGHAVSRDLLHWEHLPLALVSDELGDIWSGSCVVDWRDSSGLFGGKAGLVAIFTHYKEGLQSQSIAYSADRGRSWTKYAGNPVIPNPGIKDFRDPKVLWHEESGKWIMAVAVDKRIWFYSSANLREWEFESEFGEGEGSHAAVWECPDLFPLTVNGERSRRKWVLHVSIGDNKETDGSTAQYFVGEFDGRRFVNEAAKGGEPLWTDYGQDFYAAVTYSDIPEDDGRTIWLGWTSNWKYPFAGPTEPWKGGMSLPRELELIEAEGGGLRLCQKPVRELQRLRKEELRFGTVRVRDGAIRLDFRGTSYEVAAEVEWEDAEAFGLSVCCSEEGEGAEATVIGYETARELAFVDRNRSGMSEFINREGEPFHFGKRFEAPYKAAGNRIRLHAFVDESVIELFVGSGETVFTTLMYPSPGSDGLELFASGGSAVFRSVEVYRLASIWEEH